MLYSGGHLLIPGTFSWNRPNHSQTLIEEPLYSGPLYGGNCYSGCNFLSQQEKYKPN